VKREHPEPPIGAVMTTITLAAADACQRAGVSLSAMLVGSVLVSAYYGIRYELWARRNR
jgi:hypothetical protein